MRKPSSGRWLGSVDASPQLSGVASAVCERRLPVVGRFLLRKTSLCIELRLPSKLIKSVAGAGGRAHKYNAPDCFAQLRPFHIIASQHDTTFLRLSRNIAAGLSATCRRQTQGGVTRMIMDLLRGSSQTFQTTRECYVEVTGIWTILTYRDGLSCLR